MIATLEGMNYAHLADSLRQAGFVERFEPQGRTFEHPSGARLSLPPLADSEALRAYHYAAARVMMGDYDLMPRDAFDLLLLRTAGKAAITIAN